MWEKLRPETVARYVRFDRTATNWSYDLHRDDMYSKQAEGVAFLWNRLSDYDIALLADEVGMGKTLQALSIMALLFHQKPDARVLIIAPRRVVAENWISEYRTFIAQHYKREQNQYNLVCAEPGGDPIHPPLHCQNLYDLQRMYEKCWPHVCIIRTSNFSGLVHDDSVGAHSCAPDDNQCIAFNEAKRIREKIYDAALNRGAGEGTPPFDLLIVDEAHYFRTKDGGSQKVAAAQAFFGSDRLESESSDNNEDNKKKRPIASKTLLLTATPNHSRETDIEYIFSYFPHRIELPQTEKSGLGEKAETILRSVGLRRFRRFKEKTKYQYREEVPLPASFHDPHDDFPSEIFFALYQKKLAQSASYAKRGFLHGYLEGFEAIPGTERTVSEPTGGDNGSEGFDVENDETQVDPGNVASAADYHRSEVDTDLLEDLLSKYRYHYGDKNKAPNHPKYDKLVDNVVETTLKSEDVVEKAVVFVRRIPSTKEIARRINRKYDGNFARFLADAYECTADDKTDTEDILWRVEYAARNHTLSTGSTAEEDVEEGDPEEDQEPGEAKGDTASEESKASSKEFLEFQKSEVLEMFSIKKGETNSGRFQKFLELYRQIQSFRKKIVTRHSIFPLLFHPGMDYRKRPYSVSDLDVVRRREKVVKIDYEGSAFFQRKSLFPEEEDTKLSMLERMWGLEQSEVSESSRTQEEKVDKDLAQNGGVDTLWTVFLRLLERKGEKYDSVLREYRNLSVLQRESLARFVRQGILNASELIVVLFGLYVKAASGFQGKNLQRFQLDLYRKFMSLVEDKMAEPGSRLFHVMRLSVDLFRTIQTKELAIHNEEDLLDRSYWRWNIFNSQSPAYGYHGGTSNESILHAFNTPFFPNVLVATSILQEGVNLHMFCNTVYHYGIAWTAGDNEQRVGRVDRFFGKAHRSIIHRNTGQVLSIYPFLEQTLDETQLANFVRKKYRAEQLIDECRLDDSSPEIQTDEGGDWQNLFLLRQPRKEVDDTGVTIDQDHNDKETKHVADYQGMASDFKGRRYVDPYPAVDENRLGRSWPADDYEAGVYEISKTLPFSQVVGTLKEYAEHIAGAYDARLYMSKDPMDRTFCVLEPELFELPYSATSRNRDSGDEAIRTTRSQPIFFRLAYQTEVSGIDRGTVYLLSLTSPIANKEVYDFWDEKELEKLSGKLQKKYPGVQLALNEDLPFQSHFYLSTRIDIPVFFDKQGFENLSELELRVVFEALLYYSDLMEYEISKKFGQDLKLESDLGDSRSRVVASKPREIKNQPQGIARGAEEISADWKLLPSDAGNFYRYRIKVRKHTTRFEEILRLNHDYPFVFFDNTKKYTYLNTIFPAVDFQQRESKLLEHWATYVASEV